MSEQSIEQEIQAKGKVAPRITPDHIDSCIVGEYYFTGADGVAGWFAKTKDDKDIAFQVSNDKTPQSLHLLTFCVLVLKNGFTVTGESACASPENFDAEIGRKVARQNARDKIWALEGYALKTKLSQGE